MTDQEALAIAEEAAAAWKGKNIRVVRAVVYEGPAEAVFRCLAQSVPCGPRDRGGYTVTISQAPIVEIPNDAE